MAATPLENSLPPSFGFADGRLRLDPRDPVFVQDPYPTYRALHRGGGTAYWDRAGGLAIADHATVSRLLRDRRFGRILPADETGRSGFSAGREHLTAFDAIESHSLLNLEPPTHTRLRSLVTRAFVGRQIERLAPRIAALADALLDEVADNGTVELVEAFATPLPVRVIAEMIGVGADDTPLLLDWSHRMVAMYRFEPAPATEESANAAARDFRSYLAALIADKRRRPGDDLVSVLIAAESSEGRLDEAEMISTLALLLNAGHEATVHQISNAVKSILLAEQSTTELFSSNQSSETVVEECLRIDTPLHLFQRIALEPVDLSTDWHLARGDKVALLLGAANHDGSVFDQPENFKPARPANCHVSFGGGIHFCIGAPLARLELRIALPALFRRLPDLSLVGTPIYRDSWHFRGLERLELAFTPQRASVRP